LYDLILAANYMDIKSLLHLGCAKVASLIKGQPLEKIKEILDPNPGLPKVADKKDAKTDNKMNDKSDTKTDAPTTTAPISSNVMASDSSAASASDSSAAGATAAVKK
jgi:hypothetical protein